MRFFNRVWHVFICLCLLTGCSKQREPSKLDAWMQEKDKVRVLSTTAMIGDLVAKVGKEHVAGEVLILGEIDPHSYELVKGDDEKISFAQIVFYNGLGLEHGASLRYALQKHPHAVAVGNAVQKEHPELILIEEGQVDPHIWMDISLWAGTVEPIVDTLSQIDPDHQQEYQNNGEELLKEMMNAHQKIREEMLQIPSEKRFLVTSHDAFNYFTRAYLADASERERDQWQKRFEAPEGLAPDGQLSAADIQRIINHICFYHVTVLFPESNVSRDSLKKIISACKEKGIDVTISDQVLYGDAMGAPSTDGDNYIKMIQHDANVLRDAWDHGSRNGA